VSTLHQSLGRYLIEAEIGRGAMGVVYRAYDPQIGRQVAIKTISLTGQEFANRQEYRARFLREVRAAGRLSHPGVVTIFDAGQDPETQEPYLVMEYVTGEPLSKVLARQRKLNMPLALQYAQEIAEALDYAHNQGVVHRDIKPANILITEDSHAKIADFGVAWLRQEITQVGEVVGSPAYMAPEQMSGKQGDARSDLFSLGVVLYSMITGFRPFQGNSAKTVVFKVMNIDPVPVTSFQTEVSPELDAIVSRAIAKDPEDRYPSGAALARAIQRFRESGSGATDTASFMTASLHADVRCDTVHALLASGRDSLCRDRWFAFCMENDESAQRAASRRRDRRTAAASHPSPSADCRPNPNTCGVRKSEPAENAHTKKRGGITAKTGTGRFRQSASRNPAPFQRSQGFALV